MSNIKVIGVDGARREVEYANGDSLMEVLRDAGYDEIAAMCGGCCSCATCHVKIDEQAKFNITPIDEDEEVVIEMSDDYRKESSRLSCQITLGDEQDGLTVQIVDSE